MFREGCVLALGLVAGVSAAKNSGPAEEVFQLGSTISPISSIALTTAEISAFMPSKNALFVVGGGRTMEIVDLSKPSEPRVLNSVELPGGASSVSVNGNFLAVSLLADPEWEVGKVQVMRYADSLEVLSVMDVCNQPDMVTFTPDGRNILVACEGSPDLDFTLDPEGGVAVLSAEESATWKNPSLSLLRFDGLDSTALMAAGVRKTGTRSFVQSLEPEYITVSEDSRTAWVSLQENNAVAKIDIASKKIADVYPLGFVDHSVPGFGLDAKSDSRIEIANYPLRGLRQPDGIAAFTAGGRTFVATANEGAPMNDYKAWTDVTSPLMLAQKKILDPKVFDEKMLTELQNLSVSGLERCDAAPDKQPNGLCPYMYSFGTRGVSIFDGATGALLWDSGDILERTFAKVAPAYFNWNAKKKKVKMDSRSADKGCEPENVTVGVVGGKRYLFVGLERTSGIAVFDVTEVGKSKKPSPKLVDLYLNPKDRGPEGLLFIPADKSPLPGKALLVVGYEYSKTLTVYQIK